MKIAEKKQFEPIVIEKKEKEEEKLLTKKQKKEVEKEKEYLQRKEARKLSDGKPSSSSSNRIPKLGDKSMKHPDQKPQTSDGRIPKVNSATHSNSKLASYLSAKPNTTNPKEIVRKPSTSSSLDRPVPSSDKSRTSNPIPSKPRPSSSIKPPIRDQENYKNNSSNANHSLKDRPKPLINGKVRDGPSKDLIPKKTPPEEPQRRYLPGDIRYKPPADAKPKQFPPADLKPKNKQIPSKDAKPKQFPPNDLKPKQFPPSDLKPKQFPPKDMKPKQFPPSDVRRKEFPKNKPVIAKKGTNICHINLILLIITIFFFYRKDFG